jgi:hypothetical protein
VIMVCGFQEVVVAPDHPKNPPPKTAPFTPLSAKPQKSPMWIISL